MWTVESPPANKEIMETLQLLKVDAVNVHIYSDRFSTGAASARQIAASLRDLLGKKEEVSIIFAAGISQNEMLEHLIQERDIEWQRVVAFDMDEYLHLPPDAPQTFANFLRVRLFDKLPFKAVHLLNGNTTNVARECDRFAALLDAHPVDIVCAGIGENGHLAFNDPHIAKFDDRLPVKAVLMDHRCRQQQVNDGEFATLDEVPLRAMTLTIPTLMKPPIIVLTVPGSSKAQAVYAALREPVSQSCPASVIRTHHGTCHLFMDQAAAAKLD
jgi:glucosamine-6-phosphate deaminase